MPLAASTAWSLKGWAQLGWSLKGWAQLEGRAQNATGWCTMQVIGRIGVGAAALGAILFLYSALGQNAPAPLPASYGAAPAQPLPAQQLDNLVAPIALYPDPLLGEVLAASTYPMEIAEAEQWVRDHPKWKPSKLMDEAKKQNWDPSVQGLVAFPQVLARLSQDMGWTTALGNAFLAQQQDVMQAVQRMRAQAESRGTLRSTPQATVATGNEGGQSAITIEPANPDVWYVPDYNPVYVWGPPVYGFYPPLLYPGIDIGFGWGPGIDLGLYFGGWGGWGWGGWGWSPYWYGGSILINHSFFHRYGFGHFEGDRAFGNSVWAHNPEHRLGVPYANRGVAERFAGRAGGGEAGGGFNRGEAGRQGFAREGQSQQRFGSQGFEQRGWTDNHSVFGGYHSGGMARGESDHGFSSMGA
ncbi:MAG TPA: DUF3300 domain-containing protein, partial [Bryobacteraceae bacterium]|nr:DUF3300 domain-containing protein [Bryobacteraceae bacterium]